MIKIKNKNTNDFKSHWFLNKKFENTLTIKNIIYKITIINNKRRRKI